MKIAVISALDYESELITNEINNKVVKKIAGKDFNIGTIGSHDVISVVCGIGKVNAAMTTQIMIDVFKPDIIINSGVSGGLSKEIGIYDMVVANSLCQHDYDVSPAGYKKGQIVGFDSVLFVPDEDIAKRIYEVALNNAGTSKVIMGRVATGDQLIVSTTVKEDIIKHFDADTVEMESGAIAQVCELNDVKYGVIRAISDNADEEANEDFDAFAVKAAETGASIILEFIKRS